MTDQKGRSTISLEPADPRHGTANGYRNLGCRCDQCRQANTIEVRHYRATRQQRQASGLATYWRLVPKSEQGESMSPDAVLEWVVPAEPPPPRRHTYRLPLSGGAEAILQLPDIMTTENWDYMLSVLGAMKPGIVAAAIGDTG